MNLKLIQKFRQIFSLDLLSSIAFHDLIKSIETDGIRDIPNILIHGPDQFTIELCLQMLLKTISKSDRLPTKQDPNDIYKFPHEYHMTYLSVDMNVLKYEDRRHFISFIKSVLNTDCLNPQTYKHIIVVKNAQSISENTILALRKMTEDPRCTTLFIFSTNNLSCIEKSIMSRFMLIRCCVNCFKKSEQIIKLLEIEHPIHEHFIEKTLKKSEGNLSKFLVILSRGSSDSTLTFMMDKFIEDRLNLILTQNREDIITDTAIRLEKSGIQPITILKTILSTCVSLISGEKVSDLLIFLAKADLKLKKINKLSFAFEELFWGIKKIHDISISIR